MLEIIREQTGVHSRTHQDYLEVRVHKQQFFQYEEQKVTANLKKF
jgi:hypothetical protein